VGWFWYLGTLAPVIGLVQVGQQAMADRYTYIPLTGLFLMISWGLGDMALKWRPVRYYIPLFSVAMVILLMVISRDQIKYWKNSETLFRRAIEVTSDNVLAYNNLGNVLAREGDWPEALKFYMQALRLNPENPTLHNNVGNVLSALGRLKEAIDHYRAALKIDPGFQAARSNMNRVLERTKPESFETSGK
jgi:tetratricopeptide (TPR) repeat protein